MIHSILIGLLSLLPVKLLARHIANIRSFVLAWLCFLLPILSWSQVNPLFLEPTKSQADSLQHTLQQDINDTLRMVANRDLAVYYLEANTDSSLIYNEQALTLSRKLGLKLWQADALDLLLLNQVAKGNYVMALNALREGLSIAGNPESEEQIWRLHHFTNQPQAEYARLCMLATLQLDATQVHGSLGDISQSLKFSRLGLKTASDIGDFTIISMGFRMLGSFYLKRNQPDSSLFFYQQAIDYANKSGHKKYLADAYNEIGQILLRKNQPGKALQSYRMALRSAKEQNTNSLFAESLLLLGNYHLKVSNYDSARYYLTASVVVNRTAGNPIRTIDAYHGLSSMYKKIHKSDSALSYLEMATTLKDSLLGQEKMRQLQNIQLGEELRKQELAKEIIMAKNRFNLYAVSTGTGIILLVAFLLYRNNRQKQKANTVLAATLTNLKSTQSQLIQSEKMASLGELTAGIAHEIQNPLNFVNNFSEVNSELITELKEAATRGNLDLVRSIATAIAENENKIVSHGKRADAIVKGMLQHSRKSTGQKELTDINALCDEYLRLAYHGLLAKDKSFNAKFETNLDPTLPKINVVPQDIGRVVLNLINNAFYAVSEKAKQGTAGYEPTVSVRTSLSPGEGRGEARIQITVSDNGHGIPDSIKDKIFQPFFTTKPTGQGTGLGLSLAYDIITKGHGGELKMESLEGNGSEFIISLPR